MTDEQKKDILRAYNDKSITTQEISKKYGVSKAVIARIAIAQGATPRRPKAFGHKRGEYNNKTAHKCPKCRKLTTIDGARYCAFCGEDIRTEAEKLIEKNNYLLNYSQFLPNNIRDEFVQTIHATTKYLKNH